MAKKNTQHVVPNPDGGWDIKKGGSQRSTQNFNTQQQAIDRAIKISKNQGAELNIHGKDGKIREKNSYGNDPHPPRG